LLFALEEETILIPELKAIYLSSSIEAPPPSLGIQIAADLEIPGDRKELENRLKAYLGNPIRKSLIVDIKREVIAYFRNEHYPFATVQIPEQEISEGCLHFVLIQSLLGEVNVFGNCYFSSKRFQDAIGLCPGDAINEKMILNSANFLNRNPYHQVDLIYSQGDSKNTTDLDLIVTDHFPLSVYGGVDNTGLKHIDRTRIYGGFTWGNVFGLDQILTVQYSMAPSIHKFFSITASYIVPMPFQHLLNLYGGYSQVHVRIPSSSKTKGYGSQGSLRYIVPLPATPTILHECFAGFDLKRYNNTVEFVESSPVFGQTVNLTQFLAGYNFGFEKGCHKLGFDLQLVFSPFQWIPDQSNADFESLNPFARHTYVYGRAAVNYKTMLPGKWLWTLYASGQLANRTLLPSEQFGIGGYNTVRGYEERQLNGDDAILVKTEILTPKMKFQLQRGCKNIDYIFEFLGFLDYGYAHDLHAFKSEKKNEYLLGIGPGFRFSFGHYLLARLDWGIKLHHGPFPGGWSMVHFGVTGSF